MQEHARSANNVPHIFWVAGNARVRLTILEEYSMRVTQCLLAIALVAVLVPVLAANAQPPTPPVVSNVNVTARGNYVDVTYDLEQAEGRPCLVKPEFSKDGGLTYTFPMTTISGDIGYVMPGNSKHIVWNAYADYPDEHIELAGIRVGAQDLYTALKNVLGGYWPFDVDTSDISGNGNNPTTNTGVSVISGGRFNSCANIPLGTYLHFGTLNAGSVPATWAFWFRPAEIFANGSMVLSCHGGPYRGINVHFGSPGAEQTLFAECGIPPNNVTLKKDNCFTVNQWYHVVFVLDSNKTDLYINGELVDSKKIGVPHQTIPGPYLGNTPLDDWWGKNVRGQVDDLIYFDRALLTTEIPILLQDNDSDGVMDWWEYSK